MEKYVEPHIRQDRDAMGELFIWTDIDPAHEDDFNQWYDREHMAERAGIAGFRWARRYRTSQGERRYLALYRTETMHVFQSAPYRKAFEQQTAWSNLNFTRMRNTNRRVMIVSPLAGVGTGGALAMVRLGSLDVAQRVGAAVQAAMQIDGVLTIRVLTPDPELSTPLPSENPEGRVLEPVLVIDATTEPAAAAAGRLVASELDVALANVHTFELLWDLRSQDLQTQP
ncbi:hypothetical protein IMZ29_04490 [Achromobacter sp. GG226]|uniref:DUF4286 family protein n=1 Tax=Verticiella alkaliphila TaxID=2779529 RepID=UPI001C0B6193|nr:hypothetical protein [Verticiella sp. GG226]